ncbi:MAG: hypothetical protein RI911_438 [Candidatus Parcubacteria bacterium]|jgi:uncharacterized membrane protein (UPF0127 family)
MHFLDGLSARHLVWVILGAVCFSVLFLAFIPFIFKESTLPFALTHRAHEATAYVNGTPFRVHLLTTEFQRVKGLSGKETIEPNEGMFFVFEKDGEWGIWMKDMKFSIDVIWIDVDGTIVHIEPYVHPDTYPRVFTNTTPARYVLEVAAGTVDSYNIEVGNKVTF